MVWVPEPISEILSRVLGGFSRHHDSRLDQIAHQLNRMENHMSDLNDAVADLTTSTATVNAKIDDLLTKITAPSTSDADVKAAVAQIRTLIQQNTDEMAKVAAAGD